MGIDIHSLSFLSYATARQNLGRVITIGRQSIHINKLQLEATIGRKVVLDSADNQYIFCEQLLKNYFDAADVVSIDINDHEGATFVHDLNKPIPKALKHKFDTVIDFGTSEHLFNVPQALENYSKMLKSGGQILHALPANNLNGHGFWQFSPELFYSIYKNDNGYADTEIFFADLTNETVWYRAKLFNNGKRLKVRSKNKLYVLVRTVLKNVEFCHQDIQQSDYEITWHKKKKYKNRFQRITKSMVVFWESLPIFGKITKQIVLTIKHLLPDHLVKLQKIKIRKLTQ